MLGAFWRHLSPSLTWTGPGSARYMYLQRCHSHLQRTRTCNALAPATHSHLQRTRTCSALAPATHSHLQRTRTCDALAPATLAPAIHSRTCNALAPKACPQLGNLPTPSQHCSGRFSAAPRPFRKHPLQFCDGTRRLPNSRVPSAHRHVTATSTLCMVPRLRKKSARKTQPSEGSGV